MIICAILLNVLRDVKFIFIFLLNFQLTLFNAADEWISLIVWWATADGVVVDNVAAGLDTAGSRAGVQTLLSDTRLDLGALGADHALGTAVGRRSDIRGLTRAHGVTTHHATHAVGATGSRIARVCGLYRCGNTKHFHIIFLKNKLYNQNVQLN